MCWFSHGCDDGIGLGCRPVGVAVGPRSIPGPGSMDRDSADVRPAVTVQGGGSRNLTPMGRTSG
jgi:hypothetical protein